MLTITYDSYGTQLEGEVNMWRQFSPAVRSELQALGFAYYPDGVICEGKASDYWQAGYTVDPASIEYVTGLKTVTRNE